MQLSNFQSTFTAILFGLLLVVISGQQAHAATSQWQDLGGGKARLLAVFNPLSSRIEGAIEVKLDQGWSTYWKYPGSSGIPPQFDFSASDVEIGGVQFPVPRKLVTGSASYAGYKGAVAFPFSGTLPKGSIGSIKLDLLIGLCREICIPAQASLEIRGDKLLKTDPTAQRVVSFSKLSLPETKRAEEVDLKIVAKGPGTAHVSFISTRGKSTPELFVEGPVSWTLEPATFLEEKDGRLTYTLALPQGVDETALASTKLHFTLVSGNIGIEFSH